MKDVRGRIAELKVRYAEARLVLDEINKAGRELSARQQKAQQEVAEIQVRLDELSTIMEDQDERPASV